MANGVDCLVFSKDRAAQLDLLLRSIAEHAPRVYSSLTILWDASAPEYERGYRRLIADKQRIRATFWREYDFEKQVRHWLSTDMLMASFLVDDDVFYREASLVGAVPWSFRGGDYDYPFSVDGNVYNVDHVRRLLQGLAFNDPTELEHQGHLHRDRLPFDRVKHDDRPSLVGVPANRVSKSSTMPHMGVHEFDLNERFLAGERLELAGSWEAISLKPHAEIAYV